MPSARVSKTRQRFSDLPPKVEVAAQAADLGDDLRHRGTPSAKCRRLIYRVRVIRSIRELAFGILGTPGGVFSAESAESAHQALCLRFCGYCGYCGRVHGPTLCRWAPGAVPLLGVDGEEPSVIDEDLDGCL